MSNKINQENSGKKFWLVWNPGTGHTHQKHYAFKDAEVEAKRLGLANLGQKFVVLEAICSIDTVPMVEVNMLNAEFQ